MLVEEKKKGELQRPLHQTGWPQRPPIYDVNKSYLHNAEYGPFFSETIDKKKLALTLMATGGALLPAHLKDFLDEGAEVAMTATGMMWDPFLAERYRKLQEIKEA